MFNRLVLAAAISASSITPSLSAESGTALSSTSGRYVFGQVSEFRRDRFMLDTKEGRLWAVVSDGDDETNPRLVSVPYERGRDLLSTSPDGKTFLTKEAEGRTTFDSALKAGVDRIQGSGKQAASLNKEKGPAKK